MELTTVEQQKAFSQKDTYSSDEKKYIMERLDAERRIKQKKNRITRQYTAYTEEEKKNILNELNERRLEEQIYAEIKRKQTYKKKIYTFDVRKFYKILDMGREYYMRIEDMDLLSRRPMILTLYYKVFGELKKKDFLMKTEIYSDKIFVSEDVLRVYFKGHKLEDER